MHSLSSPSNPPWISLVVRELEHCTKLWDAARSVRATRNTPSAIMIHELPPGASSDSSTRPVTFKDGKHNSIQKVAAIAIANEIFYIYAGNCEPNQSKPSCYYSFCEPCGARPAPCRQSNGMRPTQSGLAISTSPRARRREMTFPRSSLHAGRGSTATTQESGVRPSTSFESGSTSGQARRRETTLAGFPPFL